LAFKYHELSKFARPPYLGDFYRGVAVRYALMAEETSETASQRGTEQTELPTVNDSPAHDPDRFWGGECGQEDTAFGRSAISDQRLGNRLGASVRREAALEGAARNGSRTWQRS
jgi:hypothetical protein